MDVGMQKISRAEFRVNSQPQLQIYKLSQLCQNNIVFILAMVAT